MWFQLAKIFPLFLSSSDWVISMLKSVRLNSWDKIGSVVAKSDQSVLEVPFGWTTWDINDKQFCLNSFQDKWATHRMFSHSRRDLRRKPEFDPITFSENSNYCRERFLEVTRQNNAGCCHQTFCFQKFVDNAQQCFVFTPQANFPANNLNFLWRRRW